MNKLLLVLLAVCLVSVHAFVKRDTAATTASPLDTLENKLKSLIPNDIQGQLKEFFDPEKVKSNLNTLADNVNEAVKKVFSDKEAPKA